MRNKDLRGKSNFELYKLGTEILKKGGYRATGEKKGSRSVQAVEFSSDDTQGYFLDGHTGSLGKFTQMPVRYEDGKERTIERFKLSERQEDARTERIMQAPKNIDKPVRENVYKSAIARSVNLPEKFVPQGLKSWK